MLNPPGFSGTLVDAIPAIGPLPDISAGGDASPSAIKVCMYLTNVSYIPNNREGGGVHRGEKCACSSLLKVVRTGSFLTLLGSEPHQQFRHDI